MFTIIQNFSGPYSALRDVTGPCHAVYAALRGYKFESSEIEPPSQRSWPWVKLVLLSAWAEKASVGDQAVWLDPEALICKNESLEGLVAGRDIAMKRVSVPPFQWYSTDVIFVHKRSDRLKAYFDSALAAGPMGKDETLPCAAHNEMGRMNYFLASSGMNVYTLDPIHNSHIFETHDSPVIRVWRGQNLDTIIKQMQPLATWRP